MPFLVAAVRLLRGAAEEPHLQRVDKASIELFLAGIQGWKAGLQRRLEEENAGQG